MKGERFVWEQRSYKLSFLDTYRHLAVRAGNYLCSPVINLINT